MKSIQLIGIVILALISSAALAGKVQPVSVFLEVNPDGSGYAEGDMATARTSENDFELIGCGIKGFEFDDGDGGASLTGGFCQARNSDNAYVSCITTSVTLLEVLKTIGDYSYVYFEFDHGGFCTRIDVSTQSIYLPKNVKANKVD